MPLTPPTLLRNERTSIALSYGLVAALLTCAAVPVLEFGQRLRPEWNGNFLLPAVFLIALEALFAERATRKNSFPSPDGCLYRFTEMIVLFSGLKVYLYTQHGFAQFLLDLPRWQPNLANFFNGEYLFAVSLALVVWGLATYFAITLRDLEGDQYLYDHKSDEPVKSDRAVTRKRLLADIFTLAGFMLFLTAILRNNLAFLGLPTPPLQTGLLNLVLYFVFALILFAQSRFAVLRAYWSLDRAPIAPNLDLRWGLYTALLLILAAALVIFLPTRYSLGLLDSLVILIGLIQFIFLFTIFVLWLPIQFLFSLFGRSLPNQPIQPPSWSTPTFDPSTPPTTATWFDILKSIAFWIIVLTILVLSYTYYLRQHKDLIARLIKAPGFNRLARFWLWLWGGARHLTARARAALRSVVNRALPTSATASAWSFINPRRLSTRQQIYFYYLAFLRRAAVPRRPSQTPLEYQQQLSHLPPDDLAGLTDLFIEARYTSHEITRDQVSRARRFWENIKRALRRVPA